MSVLHELGLQEADLAALARDVPERRGVPVSRPQGCRWSGATTDEPDGPARAGRTQEVARTAHMREIAGWAAALRKPDRLGGPVPWERVAAILSASGHYNEAEIAAATRSIEVREEIARRAYAGAPEPGEAEDRAAALSAALGGEEQVAVLAEELVEGMRRCSSGANTKEERTMGYFEDAAAVWKTPEERAEEARQRGEDAEVAAVLGAYRTLPIAKGEEEARELAAEFARGAREGGL